LKFPWTVEAQTDHLPAAPVALWVAGGIEVQRGEPHPVTDSSKETAPPGAPVARMQFSVIGENPEMALRAIRVSLDTMIAQAAD